MPRLATRQPAPTFVADDLNLPPKLPELPADVLKRFPSLSDWKEEEDAWWGKTYNAIQGNNRFVSQSVTKAGTDTRNLRVEMNGFIAEINEEIIIIIDTQSALAKRIVTVSAMAGVAQHIKIQTTPPVGPALNDYWIDNSDLALPITYQWDGADWVEVTDPITAAGVADERTARVTADGYLEGKYTLTVIAGNVVTGMNITSATGGGTDISSVIFRATDFQIYNGVTGVTMFSVSGANVNLAGTLTVSTSGKVYIGTGTYGNTNTAWYVDSAGQFSLKDKLTWDGTTLTITGSITATTGSIGGWTINSSTLSRNNATLDSAGQLILGTSNDVVYLSATDATYRLWVGNATAGSATFRVTKAGAVTATSGTIGGWTLSSTTLSNNNAILDSAGQLVLGTSNDVVYLSATDATYRLWVGNATAGSATFSVTKTGALFSTSGTIGGFTIGASSFTAGSGSTFIAIYSTPSGGNFIQLGDNSAGAAALLGNTFMAFTGADTNVHLTLGVSANAGAITLSNSSNVSTIEMFASTGTVTATFFSGSGASLSSLNASSISSGTIANARLPSVVQLGNGSAGSPTFSYASDTGTGWFWNSAGDMRAATSGVSRLVVRDGAIVLLVTLKFDTSQQSITSETLQKFVTAQDASGATIKLAIVA